MLCWRIDLTMLRTLFRLWTFTVLLWTVLCVSAEVSDDVPEVYTDQFVMQVEGGSEVAKELARKHGFIYLAKAGSYN
ncbi:hypothetical protein CDAR_311551 [Caerostris darwini]|uniref:Uncharacterized protein n=1 Tax=Caerostris darwini TaxID=1538125 RepID=A0AAV4UUH9_9ARAC|nr:hypothetical protein CDAR_311551 [Caerostris darwini]